MTFRLAAPPHLPPAGPDLLVALDVDGTILSHSGHCSGEVIAGIQALRDTGAHIVLATGRGPVATTPVLEILGINRGYAVTSNGATTLGLHPTHPGGFMVIDTVTFPPEPTLRRLRELVPDALFMAEDAKLVRRVSAPFPDGELTGSPVVASFEELCKVPATRVTVRAPELEADELAALMARAGLRGVSYAVGWTAWVDVAPEGVSKASGLERVREHLNISPYATVAVGDGNNDHEMLDWAGWSVAMGQASVETQSHAHSLAPSISSDGLTKVLGALLAAR